jgi:hypothetical protein
VDWKIAWRWFLHDFDPFSYNVLFDDSGGAGGAFFTGRSFPKPY